MIDKIFFDEDISLKENVSCIGSFDGVHKGHQQLIKKTIELAKRDNVLPYAITFDPDPDVLLGNNTLRLTSLDKKIALFEEFGLKGVIIIPFDEKVMRMDLNCFKSEIFDKLNVKTLVCGFDFTYGYKGKGNVSTLKKQGINVEVLDEYTYYGKKISSTRIRNEILKGNITFASKMLGYEYNK